MLTFILLLIFLSVLGVTLTVISLFGMEERPRLQPLDQQLTPTIGKGKKKSGSFFLRKLALFNRPLCIGPLGRRISKDLIVAKVDLTPEEFLLIKEIIMGFLLFSTFPLIK